LRHIVDQHTPISRMVCLCVNYIGPTGWPHKVNKTKLPSYHQIILKPSIMLNLEFRGRNRK